MTTAVRRILRIFYYSATAFCLIYLGNVLQNLLHTLLLRVGGFTDVLTLGGLLDLISDLPFFTSVQADITVLALGIFGWLLIRHDRKTTIEGQDGVTRALFLAGLSCFIGLRILLAVILIVRNVDAFAQSNIPIAAPLAAALAWGAALGLVALEWGVGRRFESAVGQKVALFFALLGHWIVLMMVIWALAQAAQSALQLMNPLPLCSRQFDIFAQLVAFIARLAQTCTDTPPLPGALATLAVILLAFALYIRWAARYEIEDAPGVWISPFLSNLDAIIGAATTGAVIVFNSVRFAQFILDIITGHSETVFPQSLLSTPSEFGLASYPFAGPLVAGVIMLIFYFRRERRLAAATEDSSGLLYGIMTLAFVVGPVFLAGASLLLGHVFVAILHLVGYTDASISPDEWSFGWMLLIPGALVGGLLWKDLHAMGRGGATEVSLPGKTYVRVFLWGARLIAGACLAFLLGDIGSAVLQAPMDPTNRIAPYLVAFIVVMTPFIRYYRDLKRKWPRK